MRTSYSLANSCARTVFVLLFSCGLTLPIAAQTSSKIRAHLDAGEFPLAIELANTLEQAERNQWLGEISLAQQQSGASKAAYETADFIDFDLDRAKTLAALSNRMSGEPNGAEGGITEADFQPLIELIQNTVDTESWADNGGLGTIQAFPAGVYVDSAGTLKRIRLANNRQIEWLKEEAAKDVGNRNVKWSTELRKVSITRLEKAAHQLAAKGQPITEVMRNLAGIYEIKYLLVYPESGDIVIAGPAGPWQEDSDGRSINVATGRPTLQLDDLVVCLRNAWDKDGKFGCSINPRKRNLAATREFLATTTLKGSRWSKEIQKHMGFQDIEVFGIDSQTHTARVLVEADYRMKLIGMGLEESIPEVPSYLDRIKIDEDGKLPPTDVVRWWFTQDEAEVTADESRSVFSFEGQGVQVLSENEFISRTGDRIHTGKSNPPTEGFARDFTKHFDRLAKRYPVYNQLKNVFDLALVASLIRKEDLDERTNWNRTFFDLSNVRERQGLLAYQVKKDPALARQVDSVLNEKILKQRIENKLVKHRLVGVSGGIKYDVNTVLSKDYANDDSRELTAASKEATPGVESLMWWWD